VHDFLKQTARDPLEIVGILPPRQGEATIEKIAANAVMAGCRPEYFPVVLAAIEALADPLFNLDSVQATTHPVATLLVVNGPIAHTLGIQAGYNAFGQGFRANVTIGRAVRLVLMNVGGGLPGSGDRATQGTPAKIAYCVAENEAESPWEPLHVEAGLPATTSTVTVFGAEGPHNIQDHYSNTALGVLRTVAGAMAQAGSNNLLGRGWPLLSLGPSTRRPLRRRLRQAAGQAVPLRARTVSVRPARARISAAAGRALARGRRARDDGADRRAGGGHHHHRGRRRGQALLLAADLRQRHALDAADDRGGSPVRARARAMTAAERRG